MKGYTLSGILQNVSSFTLQHFCAGAGAGRAACIKGYDKKSFSHFFGAFSKRLNYKQLQKSNTKLESHFCFAVLGPRPIEMNISSQTAEHPVRPGGPTARGALSGQASAPSVTHFGAVCAQPTSLLNKMP